MQTRYRWYRIQLPVGTPDLLELIDAHPLGQETNQGFARVNGVLGQAVHRFLWRSKVVVTQFDESGDPVYQEVETINSTNFAIITVDNVQFLRVENPGRSIKDLLNALESLVGLGFTCQLITFDKQQPTTVFESIEAIKLIGLKVTEVLLDGGIVARMELTSKESITPDKLSILSNVSYKTEAASYELLFGGLSGLLTFHSNGTVKVSGQLAPKLLHLVEQDLAKIIRLKV